MKKKLFSGFNGTNYSTCKSRKRQLSHFWWPAAQHNSYATCAGRQFRHLCHSHLPCRHATCAADKLSDKSCCLPTHKGKALLAAQIGRQKCAFCIQETSQLFAGNRNIAHVGLERFIIVTKWRDAHYYQPSALLP